MRRRTRQASAPRVPSAADLIEEAVHLLRGGPADLGVYFAGAAPFAVGVVYFWAYLAWFTPPDGAIAAGAMMLAGLFGLMRAAQHRFAQRLRARLAGDPLERWSGRRWFSEVAAQCRLQASGIVLVPLAAMFGVPFGWVYAHYQNALAAPAAGATSALRRRRAWALACLWPAQNHWGLGLLGLLWLMVWLNIAVSFYLVPALLTSWLGLKTVFALEGWQYLNTTFLMLVTVLTHLLVGPLVKAFYVVRVFRGEARTTGADLRLVLRREQAQRRAGVAALGAAMAALLAGAPEMRAQATNAATAEPARAAAVAPLTAAELDRSLDRVLEQPEFRWRLRPVPPPPEAKKEGIVTGFVRSTMEMIGEVVRAIVRLYRKAERWVSDIFPGGDTPERDRRERDLNSSFAWMEALQVAAYVLLVVVAGLLIFVAWKVWRHNRAVQPLPLGAAPLPAGTPDLQDETLEASRLPAHEWLELARKQLVAGEWRLAWRALFLATIATHAHEGLVSLAKFKTNLDYERELRRRALDGEVLAEEFRGRRRAFEAVWYGHAAADADTAHEWLRRLEGRP